MLLFCGMTMGPTDKTDQQKFCKPTKEKTMKILDNFAQSAAHNIGFQNGRVLCITQPQNDRDALRKASKLVRFDNGSIWKIKGAKYIEIEDEGTYRAILFICNNKCHIALYRKLDNGNYYLGFHPLRY